MSWNKVKKFGFSKSTHQFNLLHKYLETSSSHPHLWLQQRFKDLPSSSYIPINSSSIKINSNQKKKNRISILADEQNPSIICPLFSFFFFFSENDALCFQYKFLIPNQQKSWEFCSCYFSLAEYLYKALFGSVFLFYIQATATVLDGFLVGSAVVVVFCLRAFLEEGIFHLFSLASTPSSNSICSCLHSWLQNGVFPLQNTKKKTH